jgi:hypothetical protein
MTAAYQVELSEPHGIADGGTSVTVADYEDVGSMYIFELEDGSTRSLGKRVVETVDAVE